MNAHQVNRSFRLIYLFSLLSICLPTQAASFDCAKASTKVEKLICSHEELSKLDDKLSDEYRQLLSKSTDKQTLSDAQRHWLKSVRNPCASEQCIASAYQARIRTLQQRLAKKVARSRMQGKFVLAYDLPKVERKYMPVLPPGGPGGFCQAFTNNLNQFRQLTFDTCSPRLSPKYPRFSRPTWQEIPLNMALVKKMMDIHHGGFRRWCYVTKAGRAAGKVKMWRLRTDFLGDGQHETMARLDHASDGSIGPYCSYYDSQQMLIDLHNPVAKAAYARPLYPLTSTLGNDVIYDSVSKHYYILAWDRIFFSSAGGAFIPDYRHGFRVSHKGAKGSVTVFLPLPQGPWPICWIDWVPAEQGKGPATDNKK